MDDDSLASVEQFLRDNGFSISDPALHASDGSGSPRFVLLDEDLLGEQRQSGDRTSERPEEKPLPDDEDSLDRSMLFDGSGLSLSDAPDPELQQDEQEQLLLVSPASSERAVDDELSEALGVATVRSEGSRNSQSSAALISKGSAKLSSKGSAGFRDKDVRSAGSDKSSSAGSKSSSEALTGKGRWDRLSDIGDSFSLDPEETKEEESVADIGEQADKQEADEGAWNGLNDLLRKNGLPAVRFRRADVGETLPDRDSLFSVIHDFVVQFEHKNQTIQDLVLASNRNSRVRSRQEGELQTSEKKLQDTQRALEKAKAEIQRLKALQKKESEEAELASKKMKNSYVRLQQQLKVSEHRVKAKEVLVERMQAKLQQQVDKESLNKTRDRRAFRSLQDREPRRANPRDSQTLETIGVYEAQREQMQEEIEHLKSQVAALNSELRDKDNFIARHENAAMKAEPPVWDVGSDDGGLGRRSGVKGTRRNYGSSSVSSDEVMLEQLEAARREQEVAAAKLRHREAVMVKKVAMIEKELLTAREQIGELKEENANLTLEAESRPSIRDYRLYQRRIHQLERQVAENKLALEEASDLNELRKYMGTKELVERDRLNHRLHLNRLNTLPRETTLEVVKHVCRVLNLTDITLIAPSLDKLCSVVTAVPRMEKFIRDVCGFVFLHLNDDVETKEEGGARFELEQVLPTLQQWMVERRKLHVLEGFKASIITELCKRSVEPSVLGGRDDESSVTQNQPTTLSRAVHIVSELVELEKGVLQHREIYTQAAEELERRPNVLMNQIVRHFSHLFQVKSVEGVLPKINETYLFVNELKNFINTVRDLLYLSKDESLVQCLNAIRDRLQDVTSSAPQAENNDESNQENVRRGNSPNFVVDKRSSNQGDVVGVRQVREMSILVRELKRELGAATMDEILPRTKRLMELLSLSIHNADPDASDSDDE